MTGAPGTSSTTSARTKSPQPPANTTAVQRESHAQAASRAGFGEPGAAVPCPPPRRARPAALVDVQSRTDRDLGGLARPRHRRSTSRADQMSAPEAPVVVPAAWSSMSAPSGGRVGSRPSEGLSTGRTPTLPASSGAAALSGPSRAVDSRPRRDRRVSCVENNLRRTGQEDVPSSVELRCRPVDR